MSDYGDSTMNGDFQPFAKDPDATLDYQFNWTAWLAGDDIQTSIFLLPDGLTEVSSSNTSKTATILVSGGNRCTTYRVTNRITTLAGRIADRTISIYVREQ